jgi:hypothetical protein
MPIFFSPMGSDGFKSGEEERKEAAVNGHH